MTTARTDTSPDLDALDEQYAQEAGKCNGEPDTRPETAQGNGQSKRASGAADEQPALIMLRDCRLDSDVYWAIEDVLPRCSMMIVYARGGSGKTYLMTSVALGIGAGRWFTHAAEQGAVLICAFERPQDAEDRLAALREKLGCQDETPVALLKLGGKALDTPTTDLIVTEAAKLAEHTGLPVRTVVIDTVQAALGGKEDDENLGRLRRLGDLIHAKTGALVVWVHHEGKGDAMGPRGHLALADACAVWWHVEEHEDGARVVHVAKAIRGPDHVALFAFKLIPFEAGRDRRDKAIVLCELQMTDLKAALVTPVRKQFGPTVRTNKPSLGSRQKLLSQALQSLAAKHPSGVEHDLLRSKFLLELDGQRKQSGKKSLTPDQGRAAFWQVLKALRDRELVEGPDNALLPSE